MTKQQFDALVTQDIQRLVAAAQQRYEQSQLSINDDDVYVVDADTREVLYNAGNICWRSYQPCPLSLPANQTAMRGMRLRWFLQD